MLFFRLFLEHFTAHFQCVRLISDAQANDHQLLVFSIFLYISLFLDFFLFHIVFVSVDIVVSDFGQSEYSPLNHRIFFSSQHFCMQFEYNMSIYTIPFNFCSSIKVLKEKNNSKKKLFISHSIDLFSLNSIRRLRIDFASLSELIQICTDIVLAQAFTLLLYAFNFGFVPFCID